MIKKIDSTKEIIVSKGAKIRLDDTNIVITRGMLEYYEEEFKVKISDEVFDFYSKMNGIEYDWELEKEQLNGFINIHSFGEMIENETEGKLWVDWYEEDDIEEIKKHRIFETIIGADYYITIKFDADGSYKLYYVPEGSVNHGGSKKLDEIPLTIEQYLNVISTFYFCYEIRHHLHKKELYENPKSVLKNLEKFEIVFGEIKLEL